MAQIEAAYSYGPFEFTRTNIQFVLLGHQCHRMYAKRNQTKAKRSKEHDWDTTAFFVRVFSENSRGTKEGMST